MSLRRGKRHTITRLRPRPRFHAFEALESRQLLAVDFAGIGNLAETKLDEVARGIRNAADRSSTALPILGNSFRDMAATIESKINGVGDVVGQAVRSLDPNLDRAGVQSALNSALRPYLRGDGLTVDEFNTTTGELSVTAHWGARIPIAEGKDGQTPRFQFDLGLPAVPLEVAGQGYLDVGLDFDYRKLSFGYDVEQGGFFVSSPANSKASVTLNAELDQNSSMTGVLGFLAVSISPTAKGSVKLDAGLTFNASGVFLSSPTLFGSANVGLRVKASISGQDLFLPNIQTDLVMSWPLFGDPEARRQDFGGSPQLEFKDVKFGMGTFLGKIVGPIVRDLRTAAKPLSPVFDVLNLEVPGISQIAQELGDNEFSFADLVALTSSIAPLPPDWKMVVDLVLGFNDVYRILDSAVYRDDSNLMIDVGNFGFGGQDVRKVAEARLADLKNFNVTDLSSLVPIATRAVDSIEKRLQENQLGNFPGVQEAFTALRDRIATLQNGAKFDFPILKDPATSVFKFLMGQDVDLVRFQADFVAPLGQSHTFPFAKLGFAELGVTFRWNLFIEAHLKAAYDTRGIRDFAADVLDPAKPVNPAVLLNGFYFDASRPLFSFAGNIGLGPSVTVPIGFVPVPLPPFTIPILATGTFQGALEARGIPPKRAFEIGLVDPNADGKVRVFQELGDQLFAVSGEVGAEFSFAVDVGPPGLQKQVWKSPAFERKLLYSTSSIDTRNPYRLADENNPKRVVVAVDLNFEGTHGANDGKDDVVRVRINRNRLEVVANAEVVRSLPLRNVSSVIVVGSGDNERFFVDGRINRPIELRGSGGYNTVELDDREDLGPGKRGEYFLSANQLQRYRGGGGILSALLGVLELNHYDMQLLNYNLTVSPAIVKIGTTIVPTYLFGGDSGTTFEVLAPTRTLAEINSKLYFVGGFGVDKVLFHDEGSSVGTRYSFGTIEYQDGSKEQYLRSNIRIPVSAGGETLFFDVPASVAEIGMGGIDYVELLASQGQNKYVVDNFGSFGVTIQSGANQNDELDLLQSAYVRYQGGAGLDRVTIGHPEFGTRVNIGSVVLDNPGGYLDVTVDNSAGTTSQTIDIHAFGIVGMLPTLIDEIGQPQIQNIAFLDRELANLTVKAGKAQDTIHVSIPSGFVVQPGKPSRFTRTDLFTGDGFDLVNVTSGDFGTLNTWNTGDPDIVQIGGPGGSVDLVKGRIETQSASVFVDDRFGFWNRRFNVDASGVSMYDPATNQFQFRVEMTDAYDFGILGSNKDNQFIVDGTPPLSHPLYPILDIGLGTGTDLVTIKSSTTDLGFDIAPGNVDFFQMGDANLDAVGPIDLRSPGGATIDALVDDRTNANGRRVHIDRDGLFWDDVRHVAFDRRLGFRSFNYEGSVADDQVTVAELMGTLSTYIAAGDGNDYVFVTSVLGELTNLGLIHVDGQAGIDTLFLYDDGSTDARVYELQRDVLGPRLSTTGTLVHYGGFRDNLPMEYVALRGTQGGSQLRVSDLPTDYIFEFIAGDGHDQINGPNVDVQWQLTNADGRHGAVSAASPNFGLSFSLVEDLFGGTADDQFVFDPVAVPIAGRVDGGGGVNTLDYRRYEAGIVANLHTGEATHVGGRVDNIFSVLGGAGDDLLVGGRVDGVGHYFEGGDGRDLMIAGATASQLIGGLDEDVLIGGTTDFDNNTTHLRNLLTVWSDRNASRQDRLIALTTARFPDRLNENSVTSNEAVNELFGAEESDLLFLSIGRDQTDDDPLDELFGL